VTTETVSTTTDPPKRRPAPEPFTPKTARRVAALERTVYGAAGIGAAFAPQMGNGWLDFGAVATGAGALWVLWSRTRDADHGHLLAACQRALPVLGLSGTYAAALINPGAPWWEYAAPVAAAVLSGVAAPLTRSRGVRREAENLPAVIEEQAVTLAPEPAQDAPTDPYTDGLARLWAASPDTGDTVLTQIRQYSPDAPDFEAVIVAPAGKAVPASITDRVVGAVYDVPPAVVTLAEIDGAGPGRLAVRVAPTLGARKDIADMDPDDLIRHVWAERIAAPGGIAPGMQLLEHRLDDNRLRLRVEAEDGRMIHLPRLQITRALRPLGVTDPELVMVDTDGLASGVVTVYREHPLISIREATPADLTMDADGRIVLGLQHDGRPDRWQLYDPELGAVTDLLVGAPGSGKSVTLNTILAAERISGVVSIVADAQNGMSLPEARGRVYHFGAGIAAVGATLAAACAVGDYREQVAAAQGIGACQIGRPWALMNVTIDEVNKVLGAEADVPREFRKWVTGLIAHFQLTGRKFLGGIRIAGQSIHLADLGDSEKIRANAKNGNVWLGRVNSGMTQSMAADLVTDGTEVTPIPKHFGSAAAELDAAWSGQETPPGPITAGRAWHLRSGRAGAMRTFKAVKKAGTFPGLVALYESAPIPGLTAEEDRIFKEAYTVALEAAERLLAGEDPRGDDEDEDGEDGGGGMKPRKAKHPGRISVPAAPRTLRDRILDALADGPLRTREIRKAVGVGEPDGPASGSVDNTLSKLADTGHVVRAGHGVWARPGSGDQDGEGDDS
jgi:hypothetical protein